MTLRISTNFLCSHARMIFKLPMIARSVRFSDSISFVICMPKRAFTLTLTSRYMPVFLKKLKPSWKSKAAHVCGSFAGVVKNTAACPASRARRTPGAAKTQSFP